MIQVLIQILMADESAFGTMLNCAVLELMDVGVAMQGLPVACTCVVVEGENRWLWDVLMMCDRSMVVSVTMVRFVFVRMVRF
jgi:ribonuclease PH